MTAEVCVMNNLGVALAADSAVTSASSTGPKIYQSADKMFLLSHSDPVAVMIFGSATFMGIPWETIIKLYRKEHGHQSHPSVLDHAKGLMRFLAKNRQLFPEGLQRAYLIVDLQAYCWHLLNRLKQTLDGEFARKRDVTEARIILHFANIMKEESKHFRAGKVFDGLPKTFAVTARKLFKREIAETVDAVFSNVPMAKRMREGLYSLASEALAKGRTSDHSGVVVAGFGKTEVFPAMVSALVSRVLARRTKYRMSRHARIAHDNSAIIAPYAQDEMVRTFMEGIDPRLNEFVERSLAKTFEDLPGKLSNALRNSIDSRVALRASLQQLTKNALKKLQRDWKEYQLREHTGPIIEVVSILPKDELASLAESLVNLTVLRRHTSTEAETVGGPIDVAVITKGDGFVWIKRKHYFDAALNPRYIAKMGGEQMRWDDKKPSNRSKKS